MSSFPPPFEAVSLSFSHGPVSCIKDITFCLESGQFYGLIGPNGSGKSTLCDLLTAHRTATTGNIYLDGEDIETISKRELALLLASVPQSFYLNFDYRVEDVVMMGRYPRIPRFSNPEESDYSAVEQAIIALDIEELKNRNVTHLSGGEKQRVMLARALAQDTNYLVLDEVTSNLDINHAVSIMKVLRDTVINEGRTVIAALHDLNLAAAFCDQLIALRNGSLETFGKTSEVLTESLIENLYHINTTVADSQTGQSKYIEFDYT